MKTQVKHHILRDYKLSGWKEKFEGKLHYRDLCADENWRKGWISFDAITWDPSSKKLYCGLNSIDGDLLYRFDPKTEKFEGLNTQSWADAYDSKIHRTLLRNPADGCFYFATSLLHDTDQQHEAPGGKIVKYDPKTNKHEVLGIPFPHLYIQSIAADFKRGIIYGFTYPAEFIIRFDLATGKSRTLATIGNSIMFAQAHNPVIDKYGNLWGTNAEIRAWDEITGPHPIRLFKYNPDTDKFTWFPTGLPRKSDPKQLLKDPPKPKSATEALGETRHKNDYGFCDALLYDGNRYIYAGTVAGVLARIDIETNQVEKIAHIMATGRFPAMALDPNGVLYGGGGMKGFTQVIRWDPKSDKIEDYGELLDSRTGEKPARIHEMAVDEEGTIYLGENDCHHRSSYLWTIQQ